MRITRQLVILLIFFCALTMQARQPDSHTHHGTQLAADPGWSALMESMERMEAAMKSVRQSSSSDVDFVRLMLPHHQAALDMAKAQLLYGQDPQIRRLAQEIIIDQQSEIELMQLWLKQAEPKGK
jgi:uncharacterized protein (DUF305 family)